MTAKKKTSRNRAKPPAKRRPDYVTGRPTVYDEKYCQQLIDHMANGYSFESFAGTIGVAYKTLYVWQDKHLEFLQAKEIGLAKSLVWWEMAGRKGMLHKGFSAAVWIFNMKNRHNWLDRKEPENDQTMHTVRIELPGQGEQQVISLGPSKE
jgi:hypothetical protein